jgi:hypothetical protein
MPPVYLAAAPAKASPGARRGPAFECFGRNKVAGRTSRLDLRCSIRDA